MILTHLHFLRYQEVFYQKLLRIPHRISLEIITVAPSIVPDEFSIESFVGDSSRTSKMYEFTALYERDIPSRTREKYGLPREVNGTIYLSPRQLVPVLGTYKLDWNTTKVHFSDRVQVIDRIIELEPLFNSCIGIQIFVKDDLKGG